MGWRSGGPWDRIKSGATRRNVTGVSVYAGPDFGSKVLQLFVEAVGKLSNVRVLTVPAEWEKEAFGEIRRENEDSCAIRALAKSN
jgi:hypothetical protein